jgi:hypothetical protein
MEFELGLLDGKMNPGVLDDYLQRMYDWLVQAKGPHATQKLH